MAYEYLARARKVFPGAAASWRDQVSAPFSRQSLCEYSSSTTESFGLKLAFSYATSAHAALVFVWLIVSDFARYYA